ncbi:flowering time control protein FCA [Neltuma alba]|uniref:flowering time control protein FCA n=1 Tax=Neltuma alba TaxID=207710 RepID=UPI0010A2FFF1|nr:flowering time control protein FCA-like [Prosopis alba]
MTSFYLPWHKGAVNERLGKNPSLPRMHNSSPEPIERQQRSVKRHQTRGFTLYAKLDRHRGDRYGNTNHDSHPYRHSRAPSRFSDAPFNNRGGGASHHRQFDSPPRRSPGRGAGFRSPGFGGSDGFRPVSGEGPGGFGFNGRQGQPLSGQKRGFPFSGRGGSPDRFGGESFAKLFVGSVPRTATEEDIRPLFEQHGNVVEVALIKDRKTGQQQGCCFIKYASPDEADQAIKALHNQHILPGGVGPIQVRYADGERERLGAVEYKLFVGSLNKQATVKEVEEIFSKYGRVEDVYLMRDEKKQSRGCGFVKYSHRDMALAAINALNGIYTMRGCDQPLTVRFADPKRPRQGDSRSPAFGSRFEVPGPRHPAFGPRFEAPSSIPPFIINDPLGDQASAPTAWRPMHPSNMGPSSNAGMHNLRPPLLPRSGDMDMTLAMNAGGPGNGFGGPSNGPFQRQALSSMSQQNFNQNIPHIPPASQQMSPLQKPIQSPQDKPSSLQMYPPAPIPYSQTPPSLASFRQVGQPQLPFSAGPLPSQQVHGLNGHFPVSQPQAQQVASPAAAAQGHAPLDASLQTNTTLTTTNQQQLSTSMQQQPLQPQQSPSQLAQMLSQQTQTLQASFHSSQKAFSQLQQQLQMMQPSSQGLTLQQNAESMKKQSRWTGAAPTADVPSSLSASAAPPISQNITPAKCDWTEHISPEGFKYYHNSVTGESRWEKPEELILSEQQRPSVQQSQNQSQPPISPQQVPQIQQLQSQGQLQGQVLQQQYQAYAVAGHQNVQGMYSMQEWMWKDKPAGI